MNRPVGSFLLFAALCTSALGNMFYGTFTMTYVDLQSRVYNCADSSFSELSGVDGISSGDTFCGTFQYDSPVIDGAFSQRPDFGNLSVSVYFPGPFGPGWQGGLRNGFGGGGGPMLTVSSGEVVALGVSFEQGPFSGYFWTGGYSGGTFDIAIENIATGSAFDAKGTVNILDAPVADCRVSEVTGTLGLLALSMSGAALVRRRFFTPACLSSGSHNR